MYEVFRMKTLTVFDPAMCCSTGVCGSDVDQVLVDFSADAVAENVVYRLNVTTWRSSP
jgi:hypothetical protein